MGSLVDSVLNSKAVIVNANAIEQPKTLWTEKISRTLWINENGLVIENASSMENDIPIRKFFIYESQHHYDKGDICGEAANLGKAKLYAENGKFSDC